MTTSAFCGQQLLSSLVSFNYPALSVRYFSWLISTHYVFLVLRNICWLNKTVLLSWLFSLFSSSVSVWYLYIFILWPHWLSGWTAKYLAWQQQGSCKMTKSQFFAVWPDLTVNRYFIISSFFKLDFVGKLQKRLGDCSWNCTRLKWIVDVYRPGQLFAD